MTAERKNERDEERKRLSGFDVVVLLGLAVNGLVILGLIYFYLGQ